MADIDSELKTGSGVKSASGAYLPDEALVSWDKQRNDMVTRNLATVIDQCVFRNGGLMMKNHVHFEACSFVLATIITLYGIERLDRKRGLLIQSLIQMSKDGKTTLQDLRHSLADHVRQEHAKAETQYKILLPLNIRHGSLLSPVRIDSAGVRFDFLSWSDVQNWSGYDEWKANAARHSAEFFEFSGLTNYVPVVAAVAGRDVQEAFDRAVDGFTLIRHALNSKYTWQIYTIQMGQEQALGRLLAPPVYGVFDSKGSYQETFVALDNPRLLKGTTLSEGQIRSATKWLHHFVPPGEPSEIKEALGNAARLYGQALETVDWRESFLNLWRVLEVLTYNQQNGQFKFQDIIKRATSLLGPDPLFSDTLTLAAEARNQLVHRGEFSTDGLTSVMLLKRAAEGCMMAVSGLWRKYPTWQDLDGFYRYAVLSDAELERGAEFSRYIRRLRRSSDQQHVQQ